MSTVVFKYDFSEHLVSKHASRIFKKIDVAVVKLSIDDKVMDALEKSKDRDFAAIKMVEKAQKVCDAATAALVKDLTELEDKYAKSKAAGKPEAERTAWIKAYREDVKKTMAAVESKLTVVPEEQWKKFTDKYDKAKKIYKSYKVNAAVDVAIGTLGVAASAAAIAGSAHTGGASLVLGVVGMVRSVAKISEVVYSIARDVEKQGNDLLSDIKSLHADFQKESKVKAVGKDLAKTAVNAVIGASLFTTVSTVAKKAETLEGKLAGAYVGGVKLSREVTETLNARKKLIADMDTLDPAKGKEKKKLQEKLDKLESGFAKLFNKAADLNAKAQRTEKQVKEIRKLLEELKDGTKTLAWFERALVALTAVGLSAASAGVSFSGDALSVLEMAKEGVTLGADLLVTAKEF